MSFIEDNDTDNYITDKKDWYRIKQYIPHDKVIWSPFYCNGEQKDIFSNMGYDIIHEDKDFFSYEPKYDIIVDNPPFSRMKDICIKLKEILTKLKEIDKPFILIMPSSKINAVWVQKLFRNDLQLIIPLKKIECKKYEDDKPFNFNWGLYYYGYKMNWDKDLIFID